MMVLRRGLLPSLVWLLAQQLGAVTASCTITDVMRVNEIVASCCEGQPNGDCSHGFPLTCSHTCSVVLVSYWDECSAMVNTLGDATFPTFQIPQLDAFIRPCEQTMRLYEHGRASNACAHSNLDSQVAAINSACCEQGEEYVCGDGPPAECDAECAFAFIPFWMNCIVTDEELHDISDVREFQQLHQICAAHMMQDAEISLLYNDVVALAENPACLIDTSQIISVSQAKAPEPTCETDQVATAVCEQFIAAGTLSCADDMCVLCGQRHTCDHTCGFP